MCFRVTSNWQPLESRSNVHQELILQSKSSTSLYIHIRNKYAHKNVIIHTLVLKNLSHCFAFQVGIITKNSCVAHEQKILLKNTKKNSVIITVEEPIPRSTDEKIKVSDIKTPSEHMSRCFFVTQWQIYFQIRLISPQLTTSEVSDATNSKATTTPLVGAVVNKDNHLNWTLQLEPNKEVELLIKYVVEHPSTETVIFEEKF